jgi:hypothetical protein
MPPAAGLTAQDPALRDAPQSRAAFHRGRCTLAAIKCFRDVSVDMDERSAGEVATEIVRRNWPRLQVGQLSSKAGSPENARVT